ncbi:tRNA-specific adenosine deaminase, putative [Talaromyces stipitatus ATCC 10500]|uniref:tRNA-specific adenosine deaminase, putative n=1 Tax=Talaromyces stipitatus (strain ATCC 10500 / CBS 375.48 / QM 6759 / NRRL 1006) TaxID=441959 RepID=B8M5U9_TALSN|nr:tRNA-specific adenosine deaminase, putative [Talaromyces stipitatus ATCC 10500]EED20076.1 tRNA-specific adenosine deaminase, putative [Talaromyces stipitatus ATCC 10500]
MEREKHILLSTRIAALVHAHFDALPARYKPRTRDDGSREWIPMSGFVVVQGQNTPSETLTCVAIATGARCLSASQIPLCHGMVLHDCHAEVLVVRALNYWLINECSAIIQQEQQDAASGRDQIKPKIPFVRRRVNTASHDMDPPFEIHPDVKIYMYSTCAPCGDCSMELCMAEQEDPTPWVISPATYEKGDQPILLDGRAHFSVLGVVRRKPCRADAEPTLSKSCSDKLALRQVTSLLSYPANIQIAPTSSAYIAALILPEEEISQVGCERAFGGGPTGRMRALVGQTFPATDASNSDIDYRFRPFEILPVPMDIVVPRWPFGKFRSDLANKAGKASKPGNISAVWIASPSSLEPYQVCHTSQTEYKPRISPESTAVVECIIGGVKQGSKLKSMSLRGASVLSRVKMWDIVHETCTRIGGEDSRWQDILESRSYSDLKRNHSRFPWLVARSLAAKEAKNVLKPWIPNSGDGDWSPLPTRRLVGVSSHYSNFSSITDSDGSVDRPDDNNKTYSSSNYNDEDPHTERYRRHQARQHKLDVDALGKPGQILVLPLKKRRRPKVKRQNDHKSDDTSTNDASPVSADLFGTHKIEVDSSNYAAYLDELHAPYSPGDTVSREEYLELQAKIEIGFTLGQLSKYYSTFPRPSAPLRPKEDIEATPNDSDMISDGEQWLAIESTDPIIDENDTSLNGKPSKPRENNKAKLRKDILAERILRDCWQLEVHDEMGSLNIHLPSQVISVILSSEQYSLEELAHSHGTKIEPFGSLNFIRVSGNRSACESVREIVKSYGAEIRTESFEQPLLNDKSWVVDGKQAKNRFLESIAETFGVFINDPRRSSVTSAAYTAKEDDFVRLKRDLEFANSTQSANEQVPFCTDVPSSAAGFMKRISTKRRQVMSLLERGKPWSRWAIPTSIQDYNENQLPPLFSQHRPTFSSEILQILREKPSNQGGLEEKLSATIGQCLFRTPNSLDSLTKINATQLGERSFPRYFHGWLHPKGESLVKTRRIFPGDRTQIRLHRFRMTPCKPNNHKLPILEVEISVPWVNAPEAKFPFSGPELLSVKAIVEESSIDYLLPEVNYDIRFTRTLTREIFNVTGTEQPEALRVALLSSLNEVLSDPRKPFPPSCHVPVPGLPTQAQDSSNRAEVGTDTIEGTYWFPGVQQAIGTMIRTYEYSGERLCYSPNVKGSLDSKSDHLNLEMFVNSMPSYYTRLQRRNNVDETLDPASDTLEQEFRAFYMTASQYPKKNGLMKDDSIGPFFLT